MSSAEQLPYEPDQPYSPQHETIPGEVPYERMMWSLNAAVAAAEAIDPDEDVAAMQTEQAEAIETAASRFEQVHPPVEAKDGAPGFYQYRDAATGVVLPAIGSAKALDKLFALDGKIKAARAEQEQDSEAAAGPRGDWRSQHKRGNGGSPKANTPRAGAGGTDGPAPFTGTNYRAEVTPPTVPVTPPKQPQGPTAPNHAPAEQQPAAADDFRTHRRNGRESAAKPNTQEQGAQSDATEQAPQQPDFRTRRRNGNHRPPLHVVADPETSFDTDDEADGALAPLAEPLPASAAAGEYREPYVQPDVVDGEVLSVTYDDHETDSQPDVDPELAAIPAWLWERANMKFQKQPEQPEVSDEPDEQEEAKQEPDLESMGRAQRLRAYGRMAVEGFKENYNNQRGESAAKPVDERTFGARIRDRLIDLAYRENELGEYELRVRRAAVIAGAAAVAAEAYVAYKTGSFGNIFGTLPHNAQPLPGTGGIQHALQPPSVGGAAQAPVQEMMPSLAEVDIQPGDYLWNVAEHAGVPKGQIMDALDNAAKQSGLPYEWHGSGAHRALKLDGSWDTADAWAKLSPYITLDR